MIIGLNGKKQAISIMTVYLNQYIEIKHLSDPQRAFERLENEFIDIMYPDRLTTNAVIMLLDVGFDPYNESDLAWLKDLLAAVLPGIGETSYSVTPYKPQQH